jgi:hypothetical protein
MDKSINWGLLIGVAVIVAVLTYVVAPAKTIEVAGPVQYMPGPTVEKIVADATVVAENARLTAELEAAQQDLQDVREVPYGYNRINPLFGGNYGSIVDQALSDIESEFNEIDSCGGHQYHERDMEVNDYDNDIDINPRSNGALDVTFHDVEIDYDNECTRTFKDVEVSYSRQGDVNVHFTNNVPVVV